MTIPQLYTNIFYSGYCGPSFVGTFIHIIVYMYTYISSLTQEIHWRGRETQLVAPNSGFHSRLDRPAAINT